MNMLKFKYESSNLILILDQPNISREEFATVFKDSFKELSCTKDPLFIPYHLFRYSSLKMNKMEKSKICQSIGEKV